jgi:transcription initiation factor IIE alpha subunit
MRQVRVDGYVFDTLMADLILHDRKPSAFLVYLHLTYRAAGRRDKRVRASLQELSQATGLSKRGVQNSIRQLTRRRLIHCARTSATAVPEYTVLRPWRRQSRHPST